MINLILTASFAASTVTSISKAFDVELISKYIVENSIEYYLDINKPIFINIQTTEETKEYIKTALQSTINYFTYYIIFSRQNKSNQVLDINVSNDNVLLEKKSEKITYLYPDNYKVGGIYCNIEISNVTGSVTINIANDGRAFSCMGEMILKSFGVKNHFLKYIKLSYPNPIEARAIFYNVDMTALYIRNICGKMKYSKYNAAQNDAESYKSCVMKEIGDE